MLSLSGLRSRPVFNIHGDVIDQAFPDQRGKRLRMKAVGIQLDGIAKVLDLTAENFQIRPHERFSACQADAFQKRAASGEKGKQRGFIHQGRGIHIQKVAVVAKWTAQVAAAQEYRTGDMSRIIQQGHFLQSMYLHCFISSDRFCYSQLEPAFAPAAIYHTIRPEKLQDFREK